MRVVVFSDSHKNYSALQRVVDAQPQGEVFLHLGDGESEFEDLKSIYPEKTMRGVAGNCDWGSSSPYVDLVACGGKKILLAHGHTLGVKYGLTELERAARQSGADIALYGHTHIAHTSYKDGLYIMNPGSVSQPRDGTPSYGIIDITPAGIVTTIVRLGERSRP